MAQRERKAYDSTVPTLAWHKGRERWYILFHHPATKKRQWKGTGVSEPPKSDGTPPKTAQLKLAEFAKLHGAEHLGLIETPTTEQGQTTINQCLDLWAAEQISEELRAAKSSLNQLPALREALGATRVTALSLALLNTTRTAWRKAGYAKATVNLRIAYIRRACRIAKTHKLIARVPSWPEASKTGKGDGWPMFDVSDNVREGTVSRDELARVNAAEAEPSIRDLNTFAFWTGMRWGGICGLTWDGFDPQTFDLRLHPRSSKNKKPVVLRLLPGTQLHEVIARRWAERQDGCKYIFDIGGKSVLTAHSRWARAWERAGLDMEPAPRSSDPNRKKPQHIFHDLRRTGLTNLRNSGVPEDVCMKISGHKTRSVFLRYLIGGEDETGKALAAVSEKIGAVPELTPVALTPQAQGWQKRLTQRGNVVQLSERTHRAPAATPAKLAHAGA